jgi:outer membrane autotransporter protein
MAVGYDMDLTQNAVLGIGYGYMNTNGDSFRRDIDVNSNNFFIYGKYQPSAWYVNSMLGYGLGKYKESKSPMGVHLGGKFDVKSYYAQVMTGYEYHNGFTPEAGLRYINVNADSYFDGAQYVSQKDDDILTAVAGIKFSKDMYKTSDYTIKPTIRLAATYDLVADDGAAEVSVFGGGKYQVDRKSLSRFGVEAGVGVTASFNDWDLSLEYNGAFRNKYNAQSGMLVVKYNF